MAERFTPVVLRALLIMVLLVFVGLKQVSAAALKVDGAVKTFDIQIGETVDLEIPLRYNGAESVEIVNVSGQCACSKARLVPSELRPGKSVKLLVHYDSKGNSPGLQKYSFICKTSSDKKYALKDALSVNLHKSIVVDQPVLYLGELSPGSTVEHSCDILMEGAFSIDKIKTVSSCNDLKITLAQRNDKKTESTAEETVCSMTIKFSTGKRHGAINEHVDLTFQCFKGRNSTIRVPVVGKIAEPVEITPAKVFLGLIRPLSTAQLHFNIVSPKGSEITVESIKTPKWIKANYIESIKKKDAMELDVTLEIGSKPELAGTILLKISGNASEQPFVLHVPCVFVADMQSGEE